MSNKYFRLGIIILMISLCFIGYGTYNLLYNNNDEIIDEFNRDSDSEYVFKLDVLDTDFLDNKIDNNEYFKYKLYLLTNSENLPNKYIEADRDFHHIDSFFSEHFDELDDESKKLYFDYVSLNNLTFNTGVRSVANTETVNLDKAYLSKNGNFLLWYTETGDSAVTFEQIEHYANLLENLVEKYDKYFNVDFYVSTETWSKNGDLEAQQQVMKNCGIDLAKYNTSIHVYFYDLKDDDIGGVYTTIDNSNRIIKFLNSIFKELDNNMIIVTPYLRINVKFLKNNYDVDSTVAHELFHHYEKYILDNGNKHLNVENLLYFEAMAQWAASNFSESIDGYSILKNANDLYADRTAIVMSKGYDNIGYQVGYLLSRFLYSFEQTIEDSKKKMVDTIYNKDGLEYLESLTALEGRKNLMADLALRNLNNDYPNNNYIGYDDTKLNYTIDGTIENEFKKIMEIGGLGLEYYKFDNKEKYEYKLTSKAENLFLFIISETNGKYKLEKSQNLKQGEKTTIDSTNYGSYDYLYIVIGNSNFFKRNSYEVIVNKYKLEKKEDVVNPVLDYKDIKGYKIKMKSVIDTYGIETITNSEGVIDEVNQVEKLTSTVNVMGIDVTTESYVDFKANKTYTKSSYSDDWTVTNTGYKTIDLENIIDSYKNVGNVTKISNDKYKVLLNSNDIKNLNPTLANANIIGNLYAIITLKNNKISKLEYNFENLMDGIDSIKITIDIYDYNTKNNLKLPNIR